MAEPSRPRARAWRDVTRRNPGTWLRRVSFHTLRRVDADRGRRWRLDSNFEGWLDLSFDRPACVSFANLRVLQLYIISMIAVLHGHWQNCTVTVQVEMVNLIASDSAGGGLCGFSPPPLSSPPPPQPPSPVPFHYLALSYPPLPPPVCLSPPLIY